ncbi:GNAT family N-acetyltransferase [Solihabitans fulvus]|uniref:GNAT family N-acetyltransferase n=1 Tax=Solihabitans fulvus TaxID=1892852 RepID=A0A5B2XFJ7_9PSEU|nr:bifunctional GNAT family N-acetyltransferase/acetate--CoA ligase family protein [Solihabitans fulvus]KAA2261835.1 GNAT family N-acetyltransferase [Solihabitans fulvus]
MTTPTTDPAWALLTDGRMVEIRPLHQGDGDAVRALHDQLPERDRYLRFFTGAPAGLPALARRIAGPVDTRHAALGAFLDGRLVGVANYEVLADATTAEVAFAVDHTAQAHGVGTLLLEHLGSLARRRGIRRLVAEVLAENTAMTRVLRDSGLSIRVTPDGTVVHVAIPLDPGDRYLDAVAEREAAADTASLTAVLRPRSIAVVGASRRTDSVGNAVLRNLVDGGCGGQLHAVNPHAAQIHGVRSYPSVDRLPDPPDLAVLCLPAHGVPDAAEQCGRFGVRALVVISAGLSGTDLGQRLRDTARQHGMRLVGPNCVGVVNTETAASLNATFLAHQPNGGGVGIVSQSGGVAIALLDQLDRLGLGVSTMVSTGDKYDVSGNDLLLWWRHDPTTELAVLYLESFGNPRKFARLARTLAAAKPVLTVRSGTSDTAQRAAASHTAAAATPTVTRDALFEQAGVIALDTLTELAGTVAALSWQPRPRGRRTAILSNAGGGGVLAADACAANGLLLLELAPATVTRLRALLPEQASLHNPVDTTAGVDAATYGACLRALLEDSGIDAVLAVTVPTALGDPGTSIADTTAGVDKPVLAVRLGQLDAVTSLDGTDTRVPSYGDPAEAAAALARVARYAAWTRRPAGRVPDHPDLDLARALATLGHAAEHHPEGGWLPPSDVADILAAFGIPMVELAVAHDEDGAAEAFTRFGRPVVLKAVAEGVLHKSAGGGVLLDLRDEAAVRAGLTELRERFGTALREVVVQPLVTPGRELLVGVSSDEVFGPLVVFGLGGTDTDLIADRAARLTPLTDTDAEALVHCLRGSHALFGPGATPRLDADAIEDVLLRVGRLAELLPEVAELDINPLVAGPTGCLGLDARIRIHPVEPTDPYLRRLR